VNLYFIGFRGAGKTTIARMVAHKLNKDFCDMDALIEKKENKSIEKIFSLYGEEYFRKLESDVLKEIAGMSGLVVSTGGGIIIREENRRLIKQTGFVIYLYADKDVIFERIKSDKNRPPLTNLPLTEEIEKLLEIRTPFYEEIADFKIDTSEKKLEECVNLVLSILEKRGIVL
jgi:shikimate kinase